MLSRCMLLAVAFGCSQALAFKTVILNENFDTLPLIANTEETQDNDPRFPVGTDGLWTPTPPTDWTIDRNGVPGFGGTFDVDGNLVRPNDGVDEWEGWSFARKDFFEAEGQGRAEFTKGQGTFAVADPDEFDDAAPGIPGAGGDYYDTTLATPFVDFTGVQGTKLVIEFDSSFRGEEFSDEGDDHQTGVLTANFGFGFAGSVEVFRWAPNEINPVTGMADPGFTGFATDFLGAQYIPIQQGVANPLNDIRTINGQQVVRGRFNPFINQSVIAVVDLPADLAANGFENVSISFALETARNDWWWAIDNVRLSIVPEPASAVMVALGLAGFAARRR